MNAKIQMILLVLMCNLFSADTELKRYSGEFRFTTHDPEMVSSFCLDLKTLFNLIYVGDDLSFVALEADIKSISPVRFVVKTSAAAASLKRYIQGAYAYSWLREKGFSKSLGLYMLSRDSFTVKNDVFDRAQVDVAQEFKVPVELLVKVDGGFKFCDGKYGCVFYKTGRGYFEDWMDSRMIDDPIALRMLILFQPKGGKLQPNGYGRDVVIGKINNALSCDYLKYSEVPIFSDLQNILNSFNDDKAINDIKLRSL